MKTFQIKVNGTSYLMEVEEVTEGQASAAASAPQPTPPAPAAAPPAPEAATQAQPVSKTRPVGPAEGTAISAPMPGTIVEIGVVEGQSVKAGDVVAVLEAMKMENEISTPFGGIVVKVCVGKGDPVNANQALIYVNQDG